MKKILMLLLVLFCFFVIPKVEAQNYKLTKIDQDGIYFVRKGGSIPDKNGKFAIYYLGGYLAYCIDPSKSIRTEDYVTADGFVDLPYSDEVKEKIELYGYYGREYPGHDNVRYSMAAQALIWQAAGGQTVTFWTGKDGTGEIIDVTKEKNEILSLVEKHRILPDLPNNIYGDVLHEVVISDPNKALDNFEVLKHGDYDAYIENNKLHVTPKRPGVDVIHLQRKKYDYINTIVFVGKDNTDTQALGTLRFSDLSERDIYLYTDGVHIFMQKIDENGNPVKINAINFKIKNLSTGEYLCDRYDCVFETDFSGLLLTNGVDFGDYQIEELENQIIKGYSWNSEKKIISITEDKVKWNQDRLSYVEVDFTNNSVSASLELHKKGERVVFNNDVTYQETNLGNVYFDLYDDNNKFITTIITDNSGYAKVDNLSVGKYYVIEKTKLDGYIENNNKINFEIKQTDSHQTHVNYVLTVKNTLKKGKLEFTKLDYDTKTTIPNTVMELYNADNLLLLTKTTDKDGKIIINNLPLGKYYLKEKESNYNYQKSNEIINFEIKENNEAIKREMINKKIVGNLILTKYGEVLKINNNEISYSMDKLPNIEFMLYDSNNNLIETLKTNNEGVVKKKLALGKYYLVEKTKLSSYKDNNEKYEFEIKKEGNKGIDVRLNINNYLKKGGVLFSKEELISHYGIEDTVMEIYNEKGELLLTKTTDNEGKILINNLPLGKYYLEEKEANFYFKITDEKVPFEIKNDGEIIRTFLTNEKIVGDLEIYKVGENYHFIDNDIIYEKTKLHNIAFDLYQEDGTLIDHIITNKNGYVKYNNLPLGKYYLVEITDLDNYNHDNNKYSFEIKKNGNEGVPVKLTIENYLKKGNLEFTKLDLNTNEGIENTIVEIYSSDNKLLLTKETNKDGKVIINNLPVGKYYIKEKEANYYYQKTNEKIEFEIKEKETVKAKMTNKKIVGDLELFKNGEDYKYKDNDIIYEKSGLANIEFELYDVTNKLITTIKTNDDGYVKYSDLPLGKYYLIEKTKLNNYRKNNDKITFEIKKDGNNGIPVKQVVDNYLKKGNLEFIKVDLNTNEGIANTIIEIYSDDNRLLLTRETNEEGKVIINNLPIGKYYIIEKEANSMYQLTNEKVFFEIKEDGETVNAKMTNEKIIVPVPKTSTKEEVIAHSISLIGFLIGIGGLYYERKKVY